MAEAVKKSARSVGENKYWTIHPNELQRLNITSLRSLPPDRFEKALASDELKEVDPHELISLLSQLETTHAQLAAQQLGGPEDPQVSDHWTKIMALRKVITARNIEVPDPTTPPGVP